MSSINCTTDSTAEALLRLVIVDTTGEPFFTCSNSELGIVHLMYLLIGEDGDGNKAVRVTIAE